MIWLCHLVSHIDGYDIIPVVIDEFLAADLQNKQLFMNAIDLFWGSVDDFRSMGIGYIALHGNEVVSVCYTSFITNDTRAIGIETKPEHQHKGLGRQLAARVVNTIIDQGSIPYWDCTSDNEGSKRIAEKLGFVRDYQYSCVGFPI